MKSKLFVLALLVVLTATAATPLAAAPLFAPCAPGAAYDPTCDVNHDGVVNVLDIQLTAGHWNQTGTWTGGGDGWLLSGNAGTNPATNFIGTTDGQPLVMQPAGGNVGIGTSMPNARFNVVGTSWFQGDSTPLPAAAGKGIAIGFAGEQGYIYGFDYATWTHKNLIVQHDGGKVVIGSSTPAAAKLTVVAPAGETGVYVSSANNNGVEVGSAGWNGLSVGTAGADGVYVGSAGQDGLFICRTGTAGSCTPHAWNNGVEIGSAQDYGVLVRSSGSTGVLVESAGVYGMRVGHANADGVYVSSAGDNGVYANTDQASGQWGFNTPDGIHGSNVLLHSLSLVAQVTGPDSLTPGDIVAVAGITDPVPGSTVYTPLVRLAGGMFANVVGVVESRMALTRKPGPAQPSEGETQTQTLSSELHSIDGAAQSGDYVAITVLGATLVKVQDGEALQPGQRVTAGADGALRALQTRMVEGMEVTEGAPTVGVVLESPKDGMVWVLVNPQ